MKTLAFSFSLAPALGEGGIKLGGVELGCWQIRITVVKQRQKQAILTPCCTSRGFRWDTSVSLAPRRCGNEASALWQLFSPSCPPPYSPHLPSGTYPRARMWHATPAAGGSGMIHFSISPCAILPPLPPPGDLFLCGGDGDGKQLLKPCPFPPREWGCGHMRDKGTFHSLCVCF